MDRHVRVTLSGYICRVRQRYPWEITGSTRDREGGWWLLLGNEDDAPNRGPRNPPHLQDFVRSCTHANPHANLRAGSLHVTQLIPDGSACRTRYPTRSLIWLFRTCHDWCNLTWKGERSVSNARAAVSAPPAISRCAAKDPSSISNANAQG